MEEQNWEQCSASALLSEFLELDDLRRLAVDTGELLGCPMLILDDTFRVAAHFAPAGFSDPVFQGAVRTGAITYEAGALISQSPALVQGMADYVKLERSAYRRRFAPLISSGVRLGYLVCVDTDGHLQRIPSETWQTVELVLAKQLFVETSRQGQPFETAEDILMHLLDGGFPSAPYFRLQIAGTYLTDFHPFAFALLDLSRYRIVHQGKGPLREEIGVRFPQAHSFQYQSNVLMFLQTEADIGKLSPLAEEFRLKIAVSGPVEDLFALPALYQTAHAALKLMMDVEFRGGSVCTVEQLRTPLLLQGLSGRADLIAPPLRALAAYDRKRGTQYCQTLYWYLTCSHSLQKTCDALFAHRNTILYRVRKMQQDFKIALDDPAAHTELLLGTALLLLEQEGPNFFIKLHA